MAVKGILAVSMLKSTQVNAEGVLMLTSVNIVNAFRLRILTLAANTPSEWCVKYK